MHVLQLQGFFSQPAIIAIHLFSARMAPRSWPGYVFLEATLRPWIESFLFVYHNDGHHCLTCYSRALKQARDVQNFQKCTTRMAGRDDGEIEVPWFQTMWDFPSVRFVNLDVIRCMRNTLNYNFWATVMQREWTIRAQMRGDDPRVLQLRFALQDARFWARCYAADPACTRHG